MEEKGDLYIPMGLKEKNEYWNGFGKKEAIQTGISVAILNIINIATYSFHKNTSISTVFFLTSIGGSIMLFTKETTNLSLYDQICNMIDFAKSQKKYEYKYLDEWE